MLQPFSVKRLFATACITADSYWNALQRNAYSKAKILEKALTQIRADLNPSLIETVLRRASVDNRQSLGLRFFIWAGQQSNYRHSALIYSKASELLGIVHCPECLVDVLESYKDDAVGSSVPVKAFKVILNLCREVKLPVEAHRVLKKMGEFNCRPDTTCYNIVIRLFAENCEVDLAKGLMEEMSLSGLYPDMITYVAVIKGFCNSGRINDARAAFHDMRNHGCSPNVVVYSALLDGMCKSGNLEMAVELLGEMEVGGNGCATPNVVSYTSLIQSLCEKGKTKEALMVLDRMWERGCKPNWVTVSTLVKGLCAEGCLDQTCGLIERMEGEKSSLNDRCYSSLVVCLLRMGNLVEAEKLVCRMLAGGVRLDGLAWSTLIQELCSKGHPLDGFRWFREIEKQCVSSVDSDAYSALLMGLCCQGHMAEATTMISMMIEGGIQAKSLYVDSIVEELKKAGESELASRLVSIGH